MTQSQNNELKKLSQAYLTVGLDRRQDDRRKYLMAVAKSETETLAQRLSKCMEKFRTVA